MSAVSIVIILALLLHQVASEGEIFKSQTNEYPIYPQCINTTHENNFTHSMNGDEWKQTLDEIYCTGYCAVWASSMTVISTNVLLWLTGFTSSGIAAGSFAAVTQSFLGNVGAGTIFATLQSLGAMGGVSMFGSMAITTFVASAVICGDFIDLNPTQCFEKEKVIYLTLEHIQEIKDWIDDNEDIQSALEETKGSIFWIMATQKTEGIKSWITETSQDLNGKYKISEKVDNALKYGKEKTGETISWIGDTLEYSKKRAKETTSWINDASHDLDEKYKISETVKEDLKYGKKKSDEMWSWTRNAAKDIDEKYKVKEKTKNVFKRSKKRIGKSVSILADKGRSFF